ncbi:ethanolamine utilization protein EutA [Exilibacterium tricleocarpae]|uniref:Ethanolamine utilization protein EutA n=1 Tax=Exilibacterium tricleocarpae TaxID=2591008 RepID=A0A545TV80_9GAMM|nr:ethanolamine ammonia-lyase reactivating factor EutA [Exilibacterium tricleocarpae]TQV81126.1 ethanolamine utilization protein EutA [Exilibacterium tricleocarpae]
MNRKTIHSVGIDIGTTTSQVIFSRLTLVNRAPVTQVPRYEFVEREICFQGPVCRTPLTADGCVDAGRLREFIDDQFAAAGLRHNDIETGAIIITGETSKAKNARQAVLALADSLGDFVVATAGPNLESVIAGRGSGAGEYSKRHRLRVLNIDIGGGTSNYAVFDSGRVVDTACLNIGGHLIETDSAGVVSAVHEPARRVLDDVFGAPPPPRQLGAEQLRDIARRMAGLIVEALGSARSTLCEGLLMTPPLAPHRTFDAVFISGGVGDAYYRLREGNELDTYQWSDIGVLLARSLLDNAQLSALPIKKPVQTLQATVIGAGAYSLSLSGSSIWVHRGELPVRNLPVLQPDIDWQQEQPDICGGTLAAGRRLDLRLREDRYVIAFDGGMPVSYRTVHHTAQQLADFYREHGNRSSLAVVVTQNDLGKVLGMELQPLLDPQPLIVIDEVRAQEGDYLDIGRSFFGGDVVPLTIKSLAFPA